MLCGALESQIRFWGQELNGFKAASVNPSTAGFVHILPTLPQHFLVIYIYALAHALADSGTSRYVFIVISRALRKGLLYIPTRELIICEWKN